MEDIKKSSESVNRLINSSAVTSATAKALKDRMKEWNKPVFFDSYTFSILTSVCNRLLNQHEGQNLVQVAFFIDERLKKGITKGWRYDHMPPDSQMYIQGLNGIDETSKLMFKNEFTRLSPDEQVAVLLEIQKGCVEGKVWCVLNAKTFFEELLTEVTEIFYAHPNSQIDIGYFGMADAYGWKNIGLNEVEFPLSNSDNYAPVFK